MQPPRLILYHKQSTSARTRFLRLPTGVTVFGEMPAGAAMVEEGDTNTALRPHPTAALRDAESRLGVEAGVLVAETEFHAEIDTPEGRIPVILAGFTTLDPPFAAAEALGGRFLALLEIRGAPEVEMELLRRAYQTILG